MLNLDPEEKVLLIMHHHWITLVGPAFIVLFSLLVPWIFISILKPFFSFAISLWYLITLMIAFGFWIDYYLDALVITDKRILDIDQIGLFRHTVSEFRMERVQDVTIEIPNFAATFFHYGNIKIQTAGEVSFSIGEVPSPHIARDLILKHAKQTTNP
ncbi:hypothetical protein A3H65_00240 [Candidatus Giovannonibacteria bacterium RIFCSPLOWO2_02_FULL_45_14]|uniref:Uncharacterized protein n=3 Tax=Parcubacteria group TaxID=1794811 RepID=A0A0H4T7U1_9BACT|nr:Uncharacterized protein [uncultured Parcubacteria bacterium Rifle_16ft_4_minimus_37658]OGF68976.1 MAG: hypothetical protein A3C75_02210 [Candidatus Giovannonibacteria bacterium RIFCSPHIGHO2_02_FULL_44_31]OGF76248.1 MAG: hypothetical protein A3E62_03905 [Candidatus Giovannonibacteria bacterium RIFCSPHIGHO2_12_FULL_44_29]OGF91144.1 MAG: hypothetical protein A3H65_00240 [Candidatus Giovannonibacteria bacterium RIFCSPLOWO2_02_FULL_45_14]OGF93605.1 MAG: hypothetical protein A3G54_03410 [Candidatu